MPLSATRSPRIQFLSKRISFFNNMENLPGNIRDKKRDSQTQATISQTGSNHFIVRTGELISEVFLVSSGLLSNGNSLDGIEVEVESEKEKLVRERFSTYKTNMNASSAKGMLLKASMPGMVRAVSVSVGDSVQKNTQVLVLEAMKMENSISAGYAGVISKIHVQPGMSVEKGAALIEFTPIEK